MISAEIKDILQNTKVVAVVGLSPKQDRPSYRVAAYLKRHGYQIIPVRPNIEEVLGEKAYSSLKDIPSTIKVDVVNVFRKSEETPRIAQLAVEIGASVLWLQEGIVSDEAKRIAEQGGLKVVMDRCMLKDHHAMG
jgi:hypothetical protein